MKEVMFRGEDSARFARFAVAIIKYIDRNIVRVKLEGREPLTAKMININGVVTDALLNGYRRSVVITELGTNFTYWAGGTNATSAIATNKIIFILEDSAYELLRSICLQNKEFIPTFVDESCFDENWFLVDNAPNSISAINAEKLIDLLHIDQQPDLLREAALVLRSYADFLTRNIQLQRICERKVISLLKKISSDDIYCDTVIALVELIGYVGTELSIHILRQIVFQTELNVHIIWAAVIALGRIPSIDVDDILLNKLIKIETSDRLVINRDDVKDSEWLEAALLLCLARRTNNFLDNDLEVVFAERLTHPHKVIQRYACLGLSRLNSLSTNTIDLLLTGLRSSSSEVEDGYYAMALVNTFKPEIYNSIWNSDRINKLISILQTKLGGYEEKRLEPDKVWGLEYLADLATSVEDNDLASKFHKKLSYLFEDWRSYYYQSLSIYEEGEDNIQTNNSDLAMRKFRDALLSIRRISNENEYVSSIIQFRKDIIQARIKYLDILTKWSRAISIEDINRLENELFEQVILFYRLYSIGVDEGTIIDRLSVYERNSLVETISKREKGSINNTIDILGILQLFLRFHIKVLSIGVSSSETDNLLQTINNVINNLYNRSGFSKGRRGVIEILRSKTSEIDMIFCNDDVDRVKYLNTLNCLRDIINIFFYSSWTMPSHMCMLSGLGRGVLYIQEEEIDGCGSEESPLLFDGSFAIVINIVVTIIEMSTGGSTKAIIVCELPNGKRISHDLPIVEGSTINSFIIPTNIISLQTSTRIDFVLIFSTDDVSQEVERITKFIKRKKS